MNLKTTALLILLFFTFSIQAQVIVFQDNDYVIHYTTKDDSIRITIESLNDNSKELDTDGVLASSDDFVQLMFDLNASGGIDFGSQVDLIYQFDSTQTNNLCSSHITGPSAITTCGTSASNGYANVKLGTSVYQASSHLIWDFVIPKAELDYSNTLCTRLSVNIHNGGDPLNTVTKIPSSSDQYFVSDYNTISLYEEADLGDQNINVCVGDTIWANADYPFYFWNTTTDDKYVIVVNYLDEYGLTINDNTCTISDSVKVNILTDSYCAGSTYGFPNVVTPNDDGANDIFQPIIGMDLLNQDWTGAKLKIYNRWGVQVYESPDNAYPIWDVRNELGEIVTTGHYFYTFLPPNNSPRVNGFFMVFQED